MILIFEHKNGIRKEGGCNKQHALHVKAELPHTNNSHHVNAPLKAEQRPICSLPTSSISYLHALQLSNAVVTSPLSASPNTLIKPIYMPTCSKQFKKQPTTTYRRNCCRPSSNYHLQILPPIYKLSVDRKLPPCSITLHGQSGGHVFMEDRPFCSVGSPVDMMETHGRYSLDKSCQRIEWSIVWPKQCLCCHGIYTKAMRECSTGWVVIMGRKRQLQ